MGELLSLLFCFFKASLSGQCDLALENLALRQQLAILKRTQKRPAINTKDRLFWVWLYRIWPEWRAPFTYRQARYGHWLASQRLSSLLDQAIAAKDRRPPFCQFSN
jgi:hypothetical protein